MEYSMCTQSVKKIFWYSLSTKKFVFQSEISTYSVILFSKIQKFYWVEELSESNQTHYGVFHFNLECRTKRVFGIACLGKKFVFQSEISAYSLFIRLFYFQNYRNFIGSRSCPNRTNHGMEYPMCIQSVKQKDFLSQLVYKKSSFFNRKFRLIRLFYFRKYRNFIGSRSC